VVRGVHRITLDPFLEELDGLVGGIDIGRRRFPFRGSLVLLGWFLRSESGTDKCAEACRYRQGEYVFVYYHLFFLHGPENNAQEFPRGGAAAPTRLRSGHGSLEIGRVARRAIRCSQEGEGRHCTHLAVRDTRAVVVADIVTRSRAYQ